MKIEGRRSRRPYSSPARQAGAEATKRAILSAARAAFTSVGYSASTIEAIAAASGVSAPTVYAVFGSKAALLSTLIAGAGGDADIRALAKRTMDEMDPRARLAGAAKVVRTIMQRERALLDVLREAGTGRPELEAARHQVHQQQWAALAGALQPIAEAGRLAPGLSADEATATFTVIASPESYAFFVDELGWSGARWERWLANVAIRLLLD
jgi:AcrR family transcriptional regulator